LPREHEKLRSAYLEKPRGDAPVEALRALGAKTEEGVLDYVAGAFQIPGDSKGISG
jgi:hypothetical protein